jgi:hypothetical protein
MLMILGNREITMPLNTDNKAPIGSIWQLKEKSELNRISEVDFNEFLQRVEPIL